jgi:hypothetical protein
VAFVLAFRLAFGLAFRLAFRLASRMALALAFISIASLSAIKIELEASIMGNFSGGVSYVLSNSSDPATIDYK